MAKISGIYIASNAGERMLEKHQARMLANAGLEGDRYAAGLGAYSQTLPRKVRDISIITRDAIDAANQELKTLGVEPFRDCETRRNIVVEDLSYQDLNGLVGKEFYLGRCKLFATELCVPCERPAKISGKKDFLRVFEARGGIRARILVAGEIQLGDLLSDSLSI